MKSFVLTPRIARRHILELALRCEIAAQRAVEMSSLTLRQDYAERAERYAEQAMEMSQSLVWMQAQARQARQVRA